MYNIHYFGVIPVHWIPNVVNHINCPICNTLKKDKMFFMYLIVIPRSTCKACSPVPASTSTVPSSRCIALSAWLLVSHTASTLLDSQHRPCGELNCASFSSGKGNLFVGEKLQH